MKLRWLRGAPEDWGLPPRRLAELDAELADHAACLEEQGQPERAQQLQQWANAPVGRRTLAGAHLAEQVSATLVRWPLRHEWIGLCWLLGWFALICASDVVAIYAVRAVKPYVIHFAVRETLPVIPASAVAWAYAAWLLQGTARAGFFACQGQALRRAWRIGWGVLLARVLQLKLIHTVLVVGALWVASRSGEPVWTASRAVLHQGMNCLPAPWLLVLGLGIAVMTGGYYRRWGWALGIALGALFLYPAAPVAFRQIKVHAPLPGSSQVETGSFTAIALAAGGQERGTTPPPPPPCPGRNHLTSMDVEHNLGTYTYYQPACYPGMALGWHAKRPRVEAGGRISQAEVTRYTSLPLFAPHAALAWLVVLVPVFGVVGFLALLALMGRRSRSDSALYALLVLCALAATLLPFLFASHAAGVVQFTPLGIVTGPLPGFESLMFNSRLAEAWTVLAGLVLSAVMPWLLVALFLRERPAHQPDDQTWTVA